LPCSDQLLCKVTLNSKESKQIQKMNIYVGIGSNKYGEQVSEKRKQRGPRIIHLNQNFKQICCGAAHTLFLTGTETFMFQK
jgi:hypothetical protein